MCNPTERGNNISKHTPGPWERETEDSLYILHKLEDDNCIDVAQVYCLGVTEEEWKANARLIAASPDLLEACKMAYDRLDLNNGEGEENEFIEQLNKAIIKAGGWEGGKN